MLVNFFRFVTASKVILMTRGLKKIVARNQMNPSIHKPVKDLVMPDDRNVEEVQ